MACRHAPPVQYARRIGCSFLRHKGPCFFAVFAVSAGNYQRETALRCRNPRSPASSRQNEQQENSRCRAAPPASRQKREHNWVRLRYSTPKPTVIAENSIITQICQSINAIIPTICYTCWAKRPHLVCGQSCQPSSQCRLGSSAVRVSSAKSISALWYRRPSRREPSPKHAGLQDGAAS